MSLRMVRPFDLAALGCATTVLACFPIDISTGDKAPSVTTAELRGVVMSTTGDALGDVKVTAGSETTTTDDDGHYELKAPAGQSRVRFALDGYVDGFRSPTRLKNYPTQLDISLLPLAEPIPMDAAEGGTLTGPRGAALRVPKDAFIDAAGSVVSGMVDVYLSPLDPSSNTEREAAPELFAELKGEIHLFESLGMLDFQVRRDGKTLSVASGTELELSIPVPDSAQPSAAIDLWSFDEAAAEWVDEGKATFDADTQTYLATIEHVALWSANQAYRATCICGVVEETGKGPLAGARIEAAGASYFGSSSSQSDANGRFCVAVRKDSDVDVAAYHASLGGESKRIHSKSEGTSIPPKSSDARCVDVGTWNVTKDVSGDSTD